MKTDEEVKQMAERKMREIRSDIASFEKIGDKVEGTYMGKKAAGNFGNDAYVIKTKEGEKLVFGTVVLTRKMAEVESGLFVRITLTALIPNEKQGQHDIKDFRVDVEDA
jgi:hypothetical protein